MNLRSFESIKNLILKKQNNSLFFIKNYLWPFFFFLNIWSQFYYGQWNGAQDCLIFSILNGNTEAQDKGLAQVSQKLISQVNWTPVPQLYSPEF